MISTRPRGRRARATRLGLLIAGLGLAATGCETDNVWLRGGMPKGITVQSERVLGLWQWSLLTAILVALMIVFLVVWCAMFFRRSSENLPRQVHYNLPIEVLYTVVPLVAVSVIFYFTAVDQTYLDKTTKDPDVTVNVVGFQWSWQFNYIGQGLSITGRPGQNPVLVLPTNRSVLFVETSPDVIHSFWVPEFLFKRDVIPGRTNKFEVTIKDKGTFAGRCAELCGVYHSRMLFTLKTVSPAEFDAFVKTAKVAAAAGSPIYSTQPPDPRATTIRGSLD